MLFRRKPSALLSRLLSKARLKEAHIYVTTLTYFYIAGRRPRRCSWGLRMTVT